MKVISCSIKCLFAVSVFLLEILDVYSEKMLET